MKALGIRSLLVAATMAASSQLYAANVGVLLTMDDLPVQPVHELVHASGIEFGFTVGGVPSQDARYAAGGPGSTTFVQDPSIEGTTQGVLSVNFPEPVAQLRFGLARSINTQSSATVELFDATSASLGAQDMVLTPMPTYAEGEFSFQGQPVSRFELSFSGQVTRFAVDNLFFQIVPEPASCLLATIGGWLFLGAPRRRGSAIHRST